MTVTALQAMKREGKKIVAVVVYDYQMAQIVDRAGVDIISIGDSVGANMWGHRSELEVTLDQMLLVCKGVRRGVDRALVSCDMPYGPLQEEPGVAVRAAEYLISEGGADMLKLDAAAEFPEAARALAEAGYPVWAQFGMTLHTAMRYSGTGKTVLELTEELKDQFVDEARLLQEAGASMLDFTNSGPVAGPAATAAVSLTELGGLGGGPWFDGRVRAIGNA